MRRLPTLSLLGAGLVLLLAALWLAWPSQRGPQLPPVPRPELSDLPAIRDQITQVYAAFDAAPNDIAATVLLGTTLHAYRYLEPAAAAYQRASLLDPGDFRWAYLLATVNALRGEQQAAIDGLEHALTLDTRNYLPARLQLAELWLDAGNYARSEEFFAPLRDDPSLGVWAHYGLGQLLLQQDEAAAAAEELTAAVDGFAKFGAAHYSLALACSRVGDKSCADEHMRRYEKWKDVRPPRLDPLLFEVDQLNDSPTRNAQRGEALAGEGRDRAAIEAFARVLELEPTHLGGHAWLIRLYGRSGELDKAEAHFRKSLEINPGWAEGYGHFGAVLREAGKPERALPLLQTAVDNNPHSAYTRTELGMARESLGDGPAAMLDYQAALELEPDNVRSNGLLARLLLKSDQYEQAIPYLSAAITHQGPDSPVIEAALANVYLKLGNTDLASEHLRLALRDAEAAGQGGLALTLREELTRLRADRDPQ